MKEFCKYCNFLPSGKICLSFKNICLLYSAKNAPYGLNVGGVSLSKKWFYHFFDKLQTF